MVGGGVVYGGGDAMNHAAKSDFSSVNQPLVSMVASANSKSCLGSRTMLNFGAVGGVKRSGDSFFQSFDQEEVGDEYLDEYFNQPEKKRRLTVDQVQFLERSFEADNKLEPERKVQLAKELGLQPRQIAVWFQNRRARWKTRQLETDYETLHANYKSLKIDYDNLFKENEKLKAQVHHLKCNGIAKGTEKANLRLSDPKELPEALPQEAIGRMIPEDVESKVSAMAFKNEEQSSAKSEVTNVDSPRLMDEIYSFQESGDSSRVEPDLSDLSHKGEDDLIEELLFPDDIYPKIGDAYSQPPVSSSYYGFPVEDHACFWSY